MKTTIKQSFYLSAFCAFGLITSFTNAQTYYKWTDASGSTHYTKTPPPKNSKHKGKVETYGAHTPTTSQTSENHEHQADKNQPDTSSASPSTSTTPTTSQTATPTETPKKIATN